eukprot:gene4228-6004_t
MNNKDGIPIHGNNINLTQDANAQGQVRNIPQINMGMSMNGQGAQSQLNNSIMLNSNPQMIPSSNIGYDSNGAYIQMHNGQTNQQQPPIGLSNNNPAQNPTLMNDTMASMVKANMNPNIAVGANNQMMPPNNNGVLMGLSLEQQQQIQQQHKNMIRTTNYMQPQMMPLTNGMVTNNQMNQQYQMQQAMGQQQLQPGQMQHLHLPTHPSMPQQPQQQQQQQQQQQSLLIAGTKFPAKVWHNQSEHILIRTEMVQKIIELLKTRRPNATEDWHEKLPHMAKRLEDALYHDASTLEDYSDYGSLKTRLQQLAMSMGGSKPPGAVVTKPNNAVPTNNNNDPRMMLIRQQQLQQQQQQQQQQMHQHQITNQQQMQQQQQMVGQQHMVQPAYSQQPMNQQLAAALNQQQLGQFPYPPQQQQLRTAQAAASQYPQVSIPSQMMPNMQSQGISINGGQNGVQQMPNQIPMSNMMNNHNQMPMQMNQQPYHNAMPIDYQMQNPNHMMLAPHPIVQMPQYINNGEKPPTNQINQIENNYMNLNNPNNININQMQPRMYDNQIQGNNMMMPPITWHSQGDHSKLRTETIMLISDQLKLARPENSGDDWNEIAKRYEESYFQMSTSLDVYIDRNNVKSYVHSVLNNVPMQQQRNNYAISGHPPNQQDDHNQQVGNYQGNLQHRQLPNQAILQQQPAMFAPPNSQQVQQPPPQQQQTNAHTEEHRKQVLKQQQQRLLLLRHASKCPHGNGQCPVTPHCWSMKMLWKHIMSCKDQDCKVAHCVSSRYVLSHYSKCKEQSCPVCGPVREAIKRNYEKSKDVIKNATRNPQVGPGGPYQTAVGNTTNNQANTHPPPHKEEPPAKRLKKDKEKNNEAVAPNPVANTAAANAQLVIRAKPAAPKTPYPLDPISCAIYSFSSEHIEAHFKTIHEGMLLTSSKIKEICKPIMEDILRVPHAYGVFGTAVDPVLLGLPDYFDIIKMPMDLGTVVKRLDSGSYRDLQNVVKDVHLTFDNAMTYNPKNSDVHMLAKQLKKDFEQKYRVAIHDFESKINLNRKNADTCLICGESQLKFEPPVYYCNGRCGGSRIRRNAVYYSSNNNSYHWCSPCYQDLKENQPVRLPDCTLSKAELTKNKKKHTEESEEGWVECEGGCKRWVHQICSLFNARRNTGEDVSYVCPICLQAKKKANPDGVLQITAKKMKAVDLPVNNLSQFLERRIYKRLEFAYQEIASKLGVTVNEVEKCPQLILRQVSCLDKMQQTREGVAERYKDKNYPLEFPCRTKCIVLFQNIDGQDVILFGMYVYEYGHKCPAPNQRRVYISYLDSVHYFRPKQYRTMVYHEILISYLDYVKARGFHTAHIWACPPQKGDDYIFYVHPADQKTPKASILRIWYDDMLKTCVDRKIVSEVIDIHAEYLVDTSYDATVLPYFEGDYWVNEAEVIIKDLNNGTMKVSPVDGEDEEDEVDNSVNKKSKRKSKSKRPTMTSSKPLVGIKSERDPVMAKLASIIYPMRDTFFVARLHPKEYADKYAQLRVEECQREAEQNNPETNDQREKQLQEEALSGNDVTNAMANIPQKQQVAQSSEQNDAEGDTEDMKIKEEMENSQQDTNDNGEIDTSISYNYNENQMNEDDQQQDQRFEDDFGMAVAAITNNQKSENNGEAKMILSFEPTNENGMNNNEDMGTRNKSFRDLSSLVNEEIESKVDESSSSSANSNHNNNDIMDVQPNEIGNDSKSIQNNSNLTEKGSITEDNSLDSQANIAIPPPLSTPRLRSRGKLNSDSSWSKDKNDVNTNQTTNKNNNNNKELINPVETVNSFHDVNKDKDKEKSEDDNVVESDKVDSNNVVPSAMDVDEVIPISIATVAVEDNQNQTIPTGIITENESKENEDIHLTHPPNSSTCVPIDVQNNYNNDTQNQSNENNIDDSKTSVVDNPFSMKYYNPGDDMPKFSDDTEDVDEVQECEHFDTRQSFLNLCQGNHYQFDQLRRAKHTSMMVLYHLHNPDAPKFVPTCNSCHTDILIGLRFHCETCELDFCNNCYTANNGPKIHNHPLRPIAVGGAEPTPLTEEQRKEKERNVKLHLQLLQHSANCVSDCKSKNCTKMKEFLKHDSTCPVKSAGGCRLCLRIQNLLNLHARSCRIDECRVPHCIEIRDHLRNLALRQQQMDDRRRIKMNSEYSRGGSNESGNKNGKKSADDDA